MSRFSTELNSFLSGYPLQAFSGLLGNITHDLQTSGIDPAILGSVALASASMLTQGLVDVQWPEGALLPVGANVLVIAGSGTGKSLAFRTLMKPISNVLNERKFNAKSSIQPAFLIEDATREAIIQQLQDWPVAGLFSDEAGQLKQLFKHAAPALAKLLDGSPLQHARISTGRVKLTNHRLVALLMEQPSVFEASKAWLGASTGGVGLINRFLVVTGNQQGIGIPTSARIGLSEDVNRRYETKTNHLLERTIALVTSNEKRKVLNLSAEACRYFFESDAELKHMVASHSYWQHIPEYVKRHSQRVLAVSGVLHAFEHGDHGEIQLSTIEAADAIGRWSVDQFARITYQAPKITRTEEDAALLERTLGQAVYTTGHTLFNLSEMRRCASNLGLTKARFDHAICVLGSRQRVQVFPHGKSDLLQVLTPFQPYLPR